MKLKKLEIYGFKSFAQRTEIVFNQGITGIVGPNGSGKSNIGDAVRWVLGEQSAKTLRGAKMEDVIFNGTQKRKPLSYCEVSLVFDNEDRALPVDFAEVAVTRRVYRNGESEYYLNRSACRLRDIIDLFRDTGIGKEGYSIIGQGRIDDILSQRGEDRRQVFEEAAGIVKFKARKEDADKKLQRTLENMDRVEDIIKELERQLTPLEKQAETAREYLELSKELRVLDLNLFLLRHDQLKDRLAQLDETLATLAAILQQGEQALAEKTEARDRQQSKIEAIEARVTAARNELMNCADRVHTLKNEWTAAASRQENREENIRRMTGEQQSARERLEELTRMSGEQDGGLERQRQRLSEAQESQREDLQKAEADLRELIGRLLTQMERTFVENFSKMQGYFAETFVRLFGGGHAELRLADPADPLNCGIEVIAQPPGKKLQLLSLLSGGERALTAIAILFAMLKLKPTPFCILDEIEAALDEANIGYFADYLVEYSKGTQFVVVTHRKGTMERCDSLYGVAMEEQGVSKMVSVSLQDYAS